MLEEKIKELLKKDPEIKYILLDRESFLYLKENLNIPMYNQLTKYLGVYLYSIEVPYFLMKEGYENLS